MLAIVVSCLSAFPQLFAQSSRTNKKLGFTPSETYLRMISRIRAKRNRTKDTWAELDPISQPTAFDRSYVSHDPEISSQRSVSSQQPVLVPNTHRPVVHAYRGETQDAPTGSEDQIMHQIEFTVTKQPGQP